METNVTVIENVNRFIPMIQNKDKVIDDLFNKIDDLFELLDTGISNDKKYQIVLSAEYIFIKLRLKIEQEHITVKKYIGDTTLPIQIKTILQKRDQHLAQLCLKLNSIRDDISVLQKFAYTALVNGIK